MHCIKMKTKKYFYFGFILLPIIILINFSSAASYGSGPYGSGAYGIGYTAPTGGGRGCSYNWDCTNWFPAECPVSEIRERICANRGSCTGTIGIPNQTQSCKYEHKEPLFDIFLSLYEQSREACPEEKIKANVKLENYGKIELLDAFMTYWIIDENNKLIFELKDTRNVADRLNFDIVLKIPKSTAEGVYRLYAQMTYSGNKTAVAGESFKVMKEDSCRIFPNLLKDFQNWIEHLTELSGYLLFIIIGVIFLIIFILLIIIFRKIGKIRGKKKKAKEIRRAKQKSQKQTVQKTIEEKEQIMRTTAKPNPKFKRKKKD